MSKKSLDEAKSVVAADAELDLLPLELEGTSQIAFDQGAAKDSFNLGCIFSMLGLFIDE